MKKTFVTILSCIALFATAQHHGTMQPDKPSTHGMLLFGTATVYASHLPLFHAPHNHQVLLELRLDNTFLQKYVKDQQQHPEAATYTIEPEKFILPEMIANPKPFKANVYRGHFERGGIKIIGDAVVSINKVIYFKKFDENTVRPDSSNFIVFGNAKEQYAVHHITNKPDFEQIIRIQLNESFLQKSTFKMLSFSTTENSPAGVSGNKIQALDGQRKIPVLLHKQLYLEFDDLKE